MSPMPKALYSFMTWRSQKTLIDFAKRIQNPHHRASFENCDTDSKSPHCSAKSLLNPFAPRMPSFRKNALPSVSLIETQRPKALSRDASGQELGLFADVVPLELGHTSHGGSPWVNMTSRIVFCLLHCLATTDYARKDQQLHVRCSDSPDEVSWMEVYRWFGTCIFTFNP